MGAPGIEVVHPRPETAVVVLHGEHDLSTKTELHQTLTELLDAHKLVVADLSATEFIDSTVLGELVRADHKAKDDGTQFRLQLGSEPIVNRVLEITGLLGVLDWYPTREEALEGREPEVGALTAAESARPLE